MTFGLTIAALSLGFRHGVDWDHIAAIADLTSTAENRRRGFMLSCLYAVGHALVVFILGVFAIIFGSRLPAGVDEWMGRVVGLTLLAMGAWIIVDLVRRGRDFRLQSRWMLILNGTSTGLRRVRHRAHHQSHGQGHSDVLVAGNRTAAGVGALHGIGFESPTQIALFVASATLVDASAQVALLLSWVVGLLVANALLASLAGLGLLHADRSFAIYASIAASVGILSVAMGILYLAGRELPYGLLT